LILQGKMLTGILTNFVVVVKLVLLHILTVCYSGNKVVIYCY